MNKLLLKKIEEFTLHLIEKDHQLENLEDRLNEVGGDAPEILRIEGIKEINYEEIL